MGNRAQSSRTCPWPLRFRKARKLVKGRKVIEERRPASLYWEKITLRRFFNGLPGKEKEVIAFCSTELDASKHQTFVEREQFLKPRTTLSLTNKVRVSETIPGFTASQLIEMSGEKVYYLFDLDAAATANTLDKCSKIFFWRGEGTCSTILLNSVYRHIYDAPSLQVSASPFILSI